MPLAFQLHPLHLLDETDKIVWPLCYFGPLLSKLDLYGLESLLTHAKTAGVMPNEENGLEWEFVGRFAIAVVLHCATFQDLTSSESVVVGNLRGPRRLEIVLLPSKFQNLQQARAYVLTLAQRTPEKDLTAYFVCPLYNSFPFFDSLIYLIKYDEKPTVISARGLQMKLPRGLPTENPPECGVLLRGDPSHRHKDPL